jgi:hypothetical protein
LNTGMNNVSCIHQPAGENLYDTAVVYGSLQK